MADFKRVWDASDKEYDLYDATTVFGTFTKLTGGDMSISMIPYNIVGENGGITTKYIPGQISYAPIKLSCAMSDVVSELTDWFNEAVAGNLDDVYKNCSIAQYKKAGTGRTETLVIWNLINAIPIALPGFSFNAYQKTASTKFKITLQAESIEIEYPPPS
jgi:phage tail-like protein